MDTELGNTYTQRPLGGWEIFAWLQLVQSGVELGETGLVGERRGWSG